MKKKLTEIYVYSAMIEFLYRYTLRRYGYGTLQEILRELSPLPEGGTFNPAVWTEWDYCVNESLKESLKTQPFGEMLHRSLTKVQFFNAMVDFLTAYYKRTLSGDLSLIMEIIYSFSDSSITDQAAWTDWNNAIRKALQKKGSEKPIDEAVEKRLTELQAYNAMVKFLDEYYEETSADFVDGLISSLYFTVEGGTADPAFWFEWGDAVKKILQDQNSKKQIDEILGVSLTESQAFKSLVQFFRDYNERGPEPDIIIFFDYLHLLPDGTSGSPIIREKWKQCVDDALKEKPGTRKYLILGGG